MHPLLAAFSGLIIQDLLEPLLRLGLSLAHGIVLIQESVLRLPSASGVVAAFQLVQSQTDVAINHVGGI